MPLAKKRRRFEFLVLVLFLLLFLALWAMLARNRSPVDPAAESVPAGIGPGAAAEPEGGGRIAGLERETVHERHLAGGESHRYRIPLAPGDFLSLAADQLGIDLMMTLFDPGGKEVLRIDSPTGAWGAESLFVVAEASGTYGLLIEPWSRAGAGHYAVGIEELRPATETDRMLAEAARLVFEGEQLGQGKAGADLRPAIVRQQRALDLWQSAGEPLQAALTLQRLGSLYYRRGQVPSALGHYRRAVHLAEASGHRERTSPLRNELGRLYSLAGEQREAESAHREALAIARAVGDRHEEAAALNNLAVILKSIGKPWEALVAYDDALAVWRDLGSSRGEATTLHNLGSIYTLLGKLPEAFDSLQLALRHYRESEDRPGEAATLSALGWIHMAQGELERASSVLHQALEAWSVEGSPRGRAIALERLATVRMESGRDTALATYEEALALARQAADRLLEAQVRNNVGELYQRAGEPAKALPHHGAALRIFRELGERSGEAYSHFLAARAEGGLRRWSAARIAIEKALAIVEDVRMASGGAGLRASYFASGQKHYELYLDILMELHLENPRAGYDVLAFEAAERSRARSLLELLAENRGQELLSRARLVREQQRLQRAVNTIELERMTDPTSDSSSRRDVEVRQLLLEQEKLRARIRHGASGPNGWQAIEPLGLAEVRQQVLDSETQLLFYELGESSSYLMLVSRNDLRLHRLPGRSELEAEALRSTRLLVTAHRRSSRKRIRQTAEALGELLLGPVADQLRGPRLAIVGDGALHSVPFAALALGDEHRGQAEPSGEAEPSGGKEYLPLVAEYELVRLPSASTLAALRRRLAAREPAPHAVVVLADPVFDRGDPRLGERPSGQSAALPPVPIPAELERSARAVGIDRFVRLPASRAEAEAILRMFPLDGSLAALGFAADREAVLDGLLFDYRIVHFATHGLVDPTHPELSGIVLSLADAHGRPRDGFLRAHEIHALDLRADLVVLSACRTAIGKAIGGEGPAGLGRAFLHAGASRVVVSLWNVSDRGTAELMQGFYQGILHRSLAPSAALRAAQLGMLARPEWQAPYFWAGFVIEGDWSEGPIKEIVARGESK